MQGPVCFDTLFAHLALLSSVQTRTKVGKSGRSILQLVP